MISLLNMALLTLLAIVTVGVMRQRSLFGVIVLAGIYSFLMASLLIVLDAVDVAMTEAAVGAGISTVVLLETLCLTRSQAAPVRRRRILPLIISVATGGALVYGTIGLSPFGSQVSPIHRHVAPYYVANTLRDTMVPNVVTSTLADYRGYDTLGETTVIFTAGIGVMLLLRRHRRRARTEHRA